MSKQLFQSPLFAPKDFRRKLFRNSYLCLFVTLLFATTALRAYGAELVGYWNFDEGIGLTATDSSGNNNTGVLTNGRPLWTAGKFSGGLFFDGIDDYVEIGHSASLNITRELTVSAWVYNQAEYDPLLPESEYHIIAAKGWAPDPGGSWTLGWDKKTNALFFCVRRRNNNDSRCASFDFGSLAPNWHLITGVVNNNGKIRLYVDGTLAAGPVNLGTERINSNTEPVYLGSLPSSTPSEIFTWDGYLDDVRIYNAALSDVVVASLYQVDTNIISQRNFDFTIASSGNVATSQGSAVSTSINTVLTSGPSKFVSFSVSGLPANVTSSFSTSSCSPSCSTILTLQTNSSTPVGTYAINVTGRAGGATITTSFNLSISQATIPTVSTPTITPDSGIFTDSVSVSLQDATSGASIYYTTDGSAPTQSSPPYSGALRLTKSTVMKAKAFRSGYAPSSIASASLTVTQPFDFSLTNSGDASANAGSSASNSITASLSSGSSQTVSFSASGLPSGATASFSAPTCTPTCSSILTISTSGSTPGGSFPIIVTSTGAGVTKTTSFTLTVSAALALIAATPTITPNGGNYTGSVSVSIQSATSGSSTYYTTDGSTPTQSSTLYTGPMTLTNNATINAKAFKSGYNPSAVASASFTNTSTNTVTGNAYYVATNGSDSYSCFQAQNISTPKRNIMGTSGGISCLSAGDTLDIRSGTYNESIASFSTPTVPSGTSSSFITIQGHRGETVTVQAVNFGGDSTLSYVHFDNLVIVGGVSLGYANVHHIIVTNSEIKNADQHGIQIGHDGHHNQFSDVSVHDNGIGGDPHACYGMYISGHDNLFERLHIYNNPGWGAHIYYVSGSIVSNNILRDSEINNNGGSESSQFGIILSSGTGNAAYNNLIHDNTNGVLVNYGCTNCIVSGNTVYANDAQCYAGIQIGSNAVGTTVTNNTIYNQPCGTITNSGSGTLLSSNQ